MTTTTKNFSAPPPFAGKTSAPPPPPAVDAAVTGTPVEAAEKKERISVDYKPEYVVFIRENIKTMSYKDMAKQIFPEMEEKDGLRHINNITQAYKKSLRDKALDAAKAAGEVAYELEHKDARVTKSGKNKKAKDVPDFTKPVSELAQKIENWIATEFCRPMDARPANPAIKKKGEGKMAVAMNDDVAALLAKL